MIGLGAHLVEKLYSIIGNCSTTLFLHKISVSARIRNDGTKKTRAAFKTKRMELQEVYRSTAVD